MLGTTNENNNQAQSQIMSLLWPRGNVSRSSGLQTYNPYVKLPPTERLLFLPLLNEIIPAVEYLNNDSRKKIDEQLGITGSCKIDCKTKEQLNDLFLDLLLTPTEYEVIHIYPRVVGISRKQNCWEVSVEIREEIQ